MPKTKISEFSATPANNTDIDSINIAEGCAPSGINDAIRELMAQLKDFQVGSAGDPVTVGGVLTVQAGSASTPSLTTAGDTNTGMFFPAADTIAFAEGGAEVARFDSSGNLGLGVTPSAWNTSRRAIQLPNGSGIFGGVSFPYSSIFTNAYNNTSDVWIYNTSSELASRYDQIAGQHRFFTAPSGTAGNAITFTQAMTLDASGNLGVGTTSPDDITSGYTTVDVRGSTGGGLRLGVAGGNNMAIYASASTSVIEASGSSALQLVVNAAERARIDSSGNLLVNLTSPFNSTNCPLQVSNSGANQVSALRNTHASNPYGLYINYSAASPNTDGLEFLYCNDSSTLRMSVRSNGGIANYSGNNSNLSDRREKTNFAPAKSYLDVICAIPVQTFNYIDQNMEEDGGLTLGVVAQDVQAIAPELVMESNWANKDEAPKMRLSIYQTDLQYALMKCIQEQQTIIESLKARLDAANL
jgi:hypothetical protein